MRKTGVFHNINTANINYLIKKKYIQEAAP